MKMVGESDPARVGPPAPRKRTGNVLRQRLASCASYAAAVDAREAALKLGEQYEQRETAFESLESRYAFKLRGFAESSCEEKGKKRERRRRKHELHVEWQRFPSEQYDINPYSTQNHIPFRSILPPVVWGSNDLLKGGVPSVEDDEKESTESEGSVESSPPDEVIEILAQIQQEIVTNRKHLEQIQEEARADILANRKQLEQILSAQTIAHNDRMVTVVAAQTAANSETSERLQNAGDKAPTKEGAAALDAQEAIEESVEASEEVSVEASDDLNIRNSRASEEESAEASDASTDSLPDPVPFVEEEPSTSVAGYRLEVAVSPESTAVDEEAVLEAALPQEEPPEEEHAPPPHAEGVVTGMFRDKGLQLSSSTTPIRLSSGACALVVDLLQTPAAARL